MSTSSIVLCSKKPQNIIRKRPQDALSLCIAIMLGSFNRCYKWLLTTEVRGLWHASVTMNKSVLAIPFSSGIVGSTIPVLYHTFLWGFVQY